MSKRIGFIGLGIMGRPMALNLLKAGHCLTVFDRNANKVAALTAAGAAGAASVGEAAAGQDLVITMLQNSPNVREVALGPSGVAESAVPGTVFVDMSSIEPQAAREVAEGLAARGIAMLDAPVSGGELKAIDGTLSIMAGGDAAVFEAVRPVLLAMGSSAVRVGEVGAGNVAKLANQIIVAANIAAVAEALTLARKAGVDPAVVVKAIAGGLAGSTVLGAKGPMMLRGDYKPGFRMELHRKDLANALAAGQSAGSPLPLTEAVQAMLEELIAAGHGAEDHSGLVQHYEGLAGVTVHE